MALAIWSLISFGNRVFFWEFFLKGASALFLIVKKIQLSKWLLFLMLSSIFHSLQLSFLCGYYFSYQLKKQCKSKKNKQWQSFFREVCSFKFDLTVCKLADAFTATFHFHGLLFLSCAVDGRTCTYV